jgi:hypothetical protein
MSVPMRKDEPDEDITAELITADLAQGKRPVASVASAVASEDRARPFPANNR